jgi:hypothetical protein
MQLFEEELEVLQGLQVTNPELLAARHGLCSFEPHAEGGRACFACPGE